MAARIAFARLFQETNALSPVPTEAAAFERFLYDGAETRRRATPGVSEVEGIWTNAEHTGFVERTRQRWPDVELVPLFSAFAIPGGKMPRSLFEGFVDRLVDGLRQGPWAGVYLTLHGAMGVMGVEDPEGDLLQAVRDTIGFAVPLVVSFDLHGFLTPARVGAVDAMVAYRTFPHRDHRRIGREAADLLADRAQGATWTRAWRSLPMVLGGAPNLDFWPPMRQVFRALREVEAQPGVRTASLLCCQPWHDAPSLGWAAYVVTEGDPALADASADRLADAMWSVRGRLPPEIPSAEAAVDRAVSARWRRRFGTVCLADTSDAVGAGGVGENTAVLATLLDRAPDLRAVVPLRDPAAVAALWDRPIGASVDREVGGRLAPDWYAPLGLQGQLVSRHDATALGGRCVVVRAGGVRVVLTDAAPIAVGPRFFRDVGLHPWNQDLCVVKSWVGFWWYFLAHNRLSLWAKTHGVTDVDAVRHLTFDVPVSPFADLDDWRPADRIRRG